MDTEFEGIQCWHYRGLPLHIFLEQYYSSAHKTACVREQDILTALELLNQDKVHPVVSSITKEHRVLPLSQY